MVEIKLGTDQVTIAQLEVAFTKAMQRGLRDITLAAKGEWEDAAGRNLTKTRRAYQAAIKQKKVDADTYEITLNHPEEKINWLVTAIEVGYPSFGMKAGLLSGPGAASWSHYAKATDTKVPGGEKVGRPFVNVPFRTLTNEDGSAMKSQSKPNKYRRVSPTSGGWVHRGFRPIGSGGLLSPLREGVKDYINETADDVFGPLIAKMKI